MARRFLESTRGQLLSKNTKGLFERSGKEGKDSPPLSISQFFQTGPESSLMARALLHYLYILRKIDFSGTALSFFIMTL